MRRKEDFLVLIESLKGDWALCEEILSDNSRAWERIEAGSTGTILDWAALGYTMHGFYNTLRELLLYESGKFFENSLSKRRLASGTPRSHVAGNTGVSPRPAR